MDEIRNLYAYFGGELEHRGQKIQCAAINPKITKVITRDGLKKYLTDFGFGNIPLSRKDNNYYLTDWDTWQTIHKYDLSALHKYLSDRTDCDDFADYSASRDAMVYGLNSKGTISVAIYNLSDNKFIGYHRANIVICTQGDKVKFWVYDPTIGKEICEIKKEGTIEINEWWYNPSAIHF